MKRARLSNYEERPFYLIYKPKSGLSLKMVDSRGLIDYELGIFFNRVPKAGNSSVVSNLYALKYGHSIKSADELKKAKASFLRPSDLSEHQALSFVCLYKFTFVRNPYTRILSAYLDKVATGKKKYKFIEEKRIPSFQEFCLYLKKGGWRENIHWAPQSNILLLPIEYYDFIGRLENFSADMQTVLKNICIEPTGCQIGSFVVNATASDDKLRKYYNEESATIIRQLYNSDFKLFGYDDNYDFIS